MNRFIKITQGILEKCSHTEVLPFKVIPGYDFQIVLSMPEKEVIIV